MLSPLLACLLFAFDTDDAPVPPTPFDRVLELEITEHDEPAIEGHGPTAVAEYEVEFDGVLHVWTSSKLDLFLRVDDAADARLLATDDNSGGGTTPYLSINVQNGDWLIILIAGAPESVGALKLHLVAAPGSDAVRAATTAAREALRDATRLVSNDQRDLARELMAGALPQVSITAGLTDPDLLFAREELAALMGQLGDIPNARALEELVLAGFERALPNDHPNVLATRINLANSLIGMGDLAGARKLQQSALDGYERTMPGDHPDLLGARMNLASTMRQMGEFASAFALGESALAGYERTRPEDHRDRLLALQGLGNTAAQMGDIDGARALLESALAGYERSYPEDHAELLAARLNLADSMVSTGDLAGARAIEESAVAGFERIYPADHPNLLMARNNLAATMSRMGDHAGARALEESVLAGYERTLPEDHPDLLRARLNLASSMAAMGDLTGAHLLRESALAGYERSLPKDHPSLLHARLDLANSMGKSGDIEGARALQESVLASYERTLPENHILLLVARANLARSLSKIGDLSGALALEESIVVLLGRRMPASDPNLLSAKANLMVSKRDTGDVAGASAIHADLVAGMLMRVVGSLALAPREARQTVASEELRLPHVLFLGGPLHDDAAQAIFRLIETMRLVAAESMRSLAQFEADPELAPILEEAALVRRALNDLVAGAGRDESPTDGLSDELTALSLRRDRLERDAGRRLAGRGIATQPVEPEALAATLTPIGPAVGFRRVAHWFVNEATGRTEVGADRLIAHVLTSDGTLARVDLGLASELEELVITWRTTLGAPLLRGVGWDFGEGEDPEWETGSRLRARILDPVLELTGRDIKQLFVCADDLLFLLPLDALPLSSGDSDDPNVEGSSRTRVGDRIRVVNEVSFARLLTPTPAIEAVPSLLALGGVDYDADGAVPEALPASSAPIEADAEDPLPSSADLEPDDGKEAHRSRSALPDRFRKLLQARYEAEATADLFEEAFEIEPVLLTRKKTTKAALYDSVAGKRYVHLATHGWFAPESVRSAEDMDPEDRSFASMGIEERISGLAPMTLCGLALAGANNGRDSLGRVPGILTAEELCSLDLSRCELAVLSACETNVGIRRAGRGIQSLQAALYAAGARTSITSLWKVDDAATRRLMEVFYTSLWIDEMGKADALWEAKQALRDEGHPPTHWAGWVLTGDPD